MRNALGRFALLTLVVVLGVLWAGLELRQALLTRLPAALPWTVTIDGQDLGAWWPMMVAQLHAMEPHGQLGVALLLVLALAAIGLLLPLTLLGAMLAVLLGMGLVLAAVSLPLWGPVLVWQSLRGDRGRPA